MLLVSCAFGLWCKWISGATWSYKAVGLWSCWSLKGGRGCSVAKAQGRVPNPGLYLAKYGPGFGAVFGCVWGVLLKEF